MMDMEGDSGSSNAVKQPQGKKVPKEDYREWVCPHCGYCCPRTKRRYRGDTILQRIRKHVCKKSDGDVKVSPKYELKDDSTNNKIDSSQETKISTEHENNTSIKNLCINCENDMLMNMNEEDSASDKVGEGPEMCIQWLVVL